MQGTVVPSNCEYHSAWLHSQGPTADESMAADIQQETELCVAILARSECWSHVRKAQWISNTKPRCGALIDAAVLYE